MGKRIVPYTEEEIAELEKNICDGSYDNFDLGGKIYRRVPVDTIKEWSISDNLYLRVSAMVACRYIKPFLVDVLTLGLNESENFSVYCNAMLTCMYRNNPLNRIEKWAQDSNPLVRCVAVLSIVGALRNIDVWDHMDVIDGGLKDEDNLVRELAKDARRTVVWACLEDKEIPFDRNKILEWSRDKRDYKIRRDIVVLYRKRYDELPVSIIVNGLSDSSVRVREQAMLICMHMLEIRDTIEMWYDDDDPQKRKTAMQLCKGRPDVPWEIIEHGLQDTDEAVREAAKAVCLG